MASTRKKRIRRSRTVRGGKMINKIKTLRNRNINYALLSKSHANRVYNNRRSLNNVGIEEQIETFVKEYASLSYDRRFSIIQEMVLSVITPEYRLQEHLRNANESARLTKEHAAISAALQLSNPPSEMTYGLKEKEILALNKKKQELEEKIAANHVLISPEQGTPIFEILKVLQKDNNYRIEVVEATIADDAIKLEPFNSSRKNYIVLPISDLIKPITKDNVIFLKEWIHISHMIIHRMKEEKSETGHIIIMYKLTLKAAFAYHRYMQSIKFVQPLVRERANQFSDREIEIKDVKIACYSIAYDYYEFLDSKDAMRKRSYLHTFLERLKHDRARSVSTLKRPVTGPLRL